MGSYEAIWDIFSQFFFNKICGKVFRKQAITSAAWGYVSVEHATHAALFLRSVER
jgi:hypothetical protein